MRMIVGPFGLPHSCALRQTPSTVRTVNSRLGLAAVKSVRACGRDEDETNVENNAATLNVNDGV